MEEKIKKNFPNYIINNASNRRLYELLRITELCHKMNTLLVYVERNENNDDYFRLNEQLQHVEKINVIFLNKDDIYFYYIDFTQKIDKIIMSLKRKLYNENDCVICMEKCTGICMSCAKCGNFVHNECFEKCDKQICPICKHNHFLDYNKINT